MNKLMGVAGLALAGMMMVGCSSTPLAKRVSDWQGSRPFAENIAKAQESGRQVMNSDVDLVFTMEDFKKDLPDCAVTIDAVLAIGKSALNVVAEVGNTTSPLYAGAVNSVDMKWAKFVGRGIVADAAGLSGKDEEIKAALVSMTPAQREEILTKYLASEAFAANIIPNEGEETDAALARVTAETRRDWNRFLKVAVSVPDPAVLARGEAVFKKYLTVEETPEGGKTESLNVLEIESLQYKDEAGKADYSAFLVYRENTPKVQELYDNALLAKIQAVLAKVQAQMQDLLSVAAAVKDDPQVGQLAFMDVVVTVKGLGAGIGKAFADPLDKLMSSITGFGLAGDIDDLEKAAQEVQTAEASAEAAN